VKSHFQGLHLDNVYVDVGPNNDVDTHYIKWPMTALQAARKIGNKGRLSTQLQSLLTDGKFNEKVELLHVVKPRLDRDYRMMDAMNMPFSSCWYIPKDDHKISEGGYEENPYITPRWRTIAGENYGWGPGMLVLPEAKMLMEMRRTLLQAAQLRARPPVISPDDGVDLNRIAPGARLFYDAAMFSGSNRSPIEALQLGGDVPITREIMKDSEDAVWQSFFRDLITLPTDGPQMTATEVIRRHEDKIKILGPTFGRLELELSLKLAQRAIGIMFRQRQELVQEMPEVLREREVDFKFTSPIQRIQEDIDAERAGLITERMGLIGELNPDALDNANWDEIAKATLKVGPQSFMRSEDEVIEIREARQEALSQQREVEEINQDALVAEQVGKAQQANQPLQ